MYGDVTKIYTIQIRCFWILLNVIRVKATTYVPLLSMVNVAAFLRPFIAI